MRRILDGRPFLVLPDDGLSLITFGYVDNLAHALLLAVDQPEASMGEIFNCGDDERLTIRQVAEIITDELQHDWELIGMPADLAVPARPAADGLPLAAPGDGHLQAARAARLPRRRARPRGRAPRRPLAGREPARARRLRGDRAAGPVRLRRRGPPRRVVEGCRSPTRPTSATTQEPGYGKSYAGPGTRHVRPDTRI